VKTAKKVSKSQSVREYLKSHPEAATKDVTEALAKKGIEVNPNFVSQIRSYMKKSNKTGTTKPTTAKQRGRKIRGIVEKKQQMQESNGTLTIADLIEARKAANKLGGVPRAKELMDDLSKLEAVSHHEEV
jgi:5-formyltetrahydrofolate cyclo-ligase